MDVLDMTADRSRLIHVNIGVRFAARCHAHAQPTQHGLHPLIWINPVACVPAQDGPTSLTGRRTMSDLTDAVRSKLSHDLRAAIVDLEDLLHLKAADAGEQASVLRERLQERLQMLKAKAQAFEVDASRRARAAMEATDHQVRNHPWGTAGVAAVAGLLVGLLMRRR
jgi:ElaB/YqjD/DUF883 family membrane-anchored ribosome-binding protein